MAEKEPHTIEEMFVAEYKKRGDELNLKDKRIAELESQVSKANKRVNEMEDLIVALCPKVHKEGAIFFEKSVVWKDEKGYSAAAKYVQKGDNNG